MASHSKLIVEITKLISNNTLDAYIQHGFDELKKECNNKNEIEIKNILTS
jgi:hypothetical protein